MDAIRTIAVLLVVGLLVVAQLPGRLSVADSHGHSQQVTALNQGANGVATFTSTKNGTRAGFCRHFGSQAMPSFAMLDTEQSSTSLHASVEALEFAAPSGRGTLVSLHCMMNS